MKVRYFEPSDKQTFFDLCKQFYESGATFHGFNAEVTQRTFERILDKHENSWGALLLDKHSDKILGYALLTTYWSNEDGGNIMVLDELFILPTERQHGYAKAFLEWMEENYKDDVVSITLEVLTTNVGACNLYNKMGYNPDGYTNYTKYIKKNTP